MLEHGPIQLLKIEELRKLQKRAVLERVEAEPRVSKLVVLDNLTPPAPSPISERGDPGERTIAFQLCLRSLRVRSPDIGKGRGTMLSTSLGDCLWQGLGDEWGILRSAASRQQERHFLRERVEAKPGDMKLVVFPVIRGTRSISGSLRATSEDSMSAIEPSG